MTRLFTLLFFLTLALLFVNPSSLHAAPKPPPLKIHFISGSKEYKSEPSLKALKTLLESRYNVSITASWVKDGAKNLPGIQHIPNADLLIVFARRMKLPENQLKVIRKYYNTPKPVIGIRTASHAFSREENKTFDLVVLGGNYKGHYGSQSAKVTNSPKAKSHPILKGVGPITSTKLYKAGPLAKSATLLQSASIDAKNTHAVTWANQYKSARNFYTSLGVPSDFNNKSFQQLIINAIFWTTRRNATDYRRPKPSTSKSKSSP